MTLDPDDIGLVGEVSGAFRAGRVPLLNAVTGASRLRTA